MDLKTFFYNVVLALGFLTALVILAYWFAGDDFDKLGVMLLDVAARR